MMPVTFAEIGETRIIRKISGKDAVRQHLAELGLTVDGKVTVVNKAAGSVILQIKNSRIALDRSLAQRIMV